MVEGEGFRGMHEFLEFIDIKGLLDISIGGLRYTLSNFQERLEMNKFGLVSGVS